jgi:tetratricopeptide (TPR) repeat protein
MEAVETLGRAAAMKERLGETADEEAIDIYGNLAIALDDVGRLDEAESINRKAVAASRLLTGDMDPNTLTRIGNLGLIQLRQGNYAEAQKNIVEAYDGINKIWLSDSTSTAWVAGIKGSVMSDLGRFDEALVALEEHRRITANTYGKATLRYARALQKLGRWHLTLGNYKEARELLEQALATAADIGEDQSRGAGSIRLALVTLHNATGETSTAEDVARQALSAADSLARGTWIGLQRELARSLSKQGRYDEAAPLFEASLGAREEYSGKTNVSLLPILLALSKHYRRTDTSEQALSIAERAHKIGLAVTPPGSWEPAFASAEYAITLLASADPETARPLFDKAINDLIAALGVGNPRIAVLREEFEVLEE